MSEEEGEEETFETLPFTKSEGEESDGIGGVVVALGAVLFFFLFGNNKGGR